MPITLVPPLAAPPPLAVEPGMLDPVAAELYRSLQPLAYADADNGYALASYLAATGATVQPIDDIVRDSDAGPGWTMLLDVDRCPPEALPWLGQFVGVTVDTTRDEAAQRQQIRDEPGMKRGTPASMTAAAQATLTGTMTVLMLERDGGAYRLTVHTFDDETPDPDATLAALVSQKPAGIALSYSTIPRWTWGDLPAHFATWADVASYYTDWQHVADNSPPAP